MLQLKHFIYLTIVVMATMASVAAVPYKVRPGSVPTRNITRIGSNDQKDVPVSTRYITTSVSSLPAKDKKMFIATLCDVFKGHTINAAVMLHLNPDWDPSHGVVYFYIVDSKDKDEKDSLCSNTEKRQKPAVMFCTISSYTSSSTNLYLVVYTGSNEAKFTVNIDIVANSAMKDNFKAMERQKVNETSNNKLHRENMDVEYLTEVITLETGQLVDLKIPALLSVTFCPKPGIKKYEIQSTLTATDSASSFQQYICDKLPCEVDGPNVIQENTLQLPKNEIVLKDKESKKLKLYVLAVCWAGTKGDTPSGIAGKVMYTGEISVIS